MPRSVHRIHSASHALLLLNILIAMLGMRIPDLLNISVLRFGIYLMFFVCAILGFFSCFLQFKKFTLIFAMFILIVFFHGWAHFYQPSLSLGIDIQNYTLAESVSSNFSISQTRLDMMYPVIFLFPFISFFSHGLKGNQKIFYSQAFLFVLLLCGLFNCVLAFFQGFVNIHLLSSGSLTAVDANRASGFLSDSGESSFIFSIFTSGLFFLYVQEPFFNGKKIVFSLLFLIFFAAGIATNSRTFFFTIFLTLFVYVIFKIWEFFIHKDFQKMRTPLAAGVGFILLVIVVNIIKPTNPLKQFEKLQSLGLMKQGFFTFYDFFDPVRSQHLQVMWNSLKNNFFTGSGLGSFHKDLFYYSKILFPNKNFFVDVPTNFYFALLSSLGIAGFFLLLCFFILILLKVRNHLKMIHKLKLTFSSVYFVSNTLPICMIFPLVFCFFIGYHVIYPAAAFLSIYVLVSCFQLETNFFYFRKISYFTAAVSFYLSFVCGYLFIDAPRVPGFLWKENHTVQIPRPINEIQEQNLKKEDKKIYTSEILKKYIYTQLPLSPVQSDEGQWMHGNNEILLFEKEEKRIYIPKENNVFPFSIKLNYKNKNLSKYEIKAITVQIPGWIYFTPPVEASFSSCYQSISFEHYCSIQVESKSIFFIEKKYLSFPFSKNKFIKSRSSN